MASYFSVGIQLEQIHVKVCFARKNDVIEAVETRLHNIMQEKKRESPFP